jgi:uracil-DNA glycosylase
VKFECGHFKKANEWLEMRYGETGPIDWSLCGDPVGVPSSRAAKPKKDGDQLVAEPDKQVVGTSTAKPEEVDEFDPDEEEAMLQATLEAEQLFSSQGAPKVGHDAVKTGDAAADDEKSPGEDAGVMAKEVEEVHGVTENGEEEQDDHLE